MEIEEAAALIVREPAIGRLPVLDDGALAGIVTINNLAIRAGDLEVAQRITADVARAALPELLPSARRLADGRPTPVQHQRRDRLETLIRIAEPGLNLVWPPGSACSQAGPAWGRRLLPHPSAARYLRMAEGRTHRARGAARDGARRRRVGARPRRGRSRWRRRAARVGGARRPARGGCEAFGAALLPLIGTIVISTTIGAATGDEAAAVSWARWTSRLAGHGSARALRELEQSGASGGARIPVSRSRSARRPRAFVCPCC